ncbi:MAG: poly-gamma-glutamate system protein [Bacteroidia bacterium]|nr:poly-gamma-glutamate system protein [Bacteroidia bacterium]
MISSLRETLWSSVHLCVRKITQRCTEKAQSYTEKGKANRLFLLVNGLIGIGLIVTVFFLFNLSNGQEVPELRLAAENMKQSLTIIKDYCIQHKINRNNPEDPLNTGLIGPEWSEITTTVGDPEAKRTTINPNFAALIAHMLLEAGVKRGDTIAIGSSASFPALLVASLSAAKALELHPFVIISFGSSSFGASNPDFTLWDIYRLLLDHQFIDFLPVAVSIGGEDDTGSEFEKGISGRIRLSLADAGIPLIAEKDLQENIKIRNGYYFAGGLTEALPSPRKQETQPLVTELFSAIPAKAGNPTPGTELFSVIPAKAWTPSPHRHLHQGIHQFRRRICKHRQQSFRSENQARSG